MRIEWTLLGSAWEQVGKGMDSPENHMAQEGALGGKWDAYTSDETSVGARKLVETIEKPYSDLLTSHQRKYECAWPTWQNGDVSHLKIVDEITTHGECVQPM
jgi:hypothetical protein